MHRIFIGYDHRQPIAYNILQFSIVSRASEPVSITPLILEQLPNFNRQGLTPFTFSRFLVPWLCGFEGTALFLDADILLQDDVVKLFNMLETDKAVQIVMHEKKFERASVMLFNCAKCTILSPDFVATAKDLHRMSWVADHELGSLPHRWNHLVGYDDEMENPALIHYTQGVPAWPETEQCEHADKWQLEGHKMISAAPWGVLMGNSVHAVELPDGRKVPRLTFGEERIKQMIAQSTGTK